MLWCWPNSETSHWLSSWLFPSYPRIPSFGASAQCVLLFFWEKHTRWSYISFHRWFSSKRELAGNSVQQNVNRIAYPLRWLYVQLLCCSFKSDEKKIHRRYWPAYEIWLGNIIPWLESSFSSPRVLCSLPAITKLQTQAATFIKQSATWKSLFGFPQEPQNQPSAHFLLQIIPGTFKQEDRFGPSMQRFVPSKVYGISHFGNLF